jgi:hypothetical protein
MNYLSYRKALRILNREREKVGKAISESVEEARKTGGEAKAEEVYRDEYVRLEWIDEKIYKLVTRYLINKATQTFLPTPSLSEKDGLWERSSTTGDYYLTDKGIAEMRGIIRKDTKDKWRFFLIGGVS